MDIEAGMQLVEFPGGSLRRHPAFDLLSQVRAENRWLANYASPNTRGVYRRAVASFIATLGVQSPDDLYSVSQAHVLAWRSAMEEAGLSPATIANRLSALSSLYRQLTEEQLTRSNPVAGVRRPRTGNFGIGAGKSPTLSKRQVRMILEAPDAGTLQGLRDRALLHVYFYVGARCSEPGRLRVRDFGYDAEYPVLTLTIKGGKTNTVAINLDCAQAIRSYLDQAPHAGEPGAYMFQAMKNGRPGKPLSRLQLYRIFVRYARASGVAAFPHMARATMITSAFEAGCAGEDIQRTVGHASITTTEGYNHTAQKHRRSASLRIGY